MNTESIKEKLHMHVKRRIQEQISSTVESNSVTTSTSPVTTHSAGCGGGRKQQQQVPTSSSNNNDANDIQNTTHHQNPIKSPKKNKARKFTPVTIVDGESISGPSSSQIQTPHESPIITIPTDSDSTIKVANSTNNNAHTELDDKCNTVLAIILNEKKDSMMKDPEVIKCLRSIYNKNEIR